MRRVVTLTPFLLLTYHFTHWTLSPSFCLFLSLPLSPYLSPNVYLLCSSNLFSLSLVILFFFFSLQCLIPHLNFIFVSSVRLSLNMPIWVFSYAGRARYFTGHFSLLFFLSFLISQISHHFSRAQQKKRPRVCRAGTNNCCQWPPPPFPPPPSPLPPPPFPLPPPPSPSPSLLPTDPFLLQHINVNIVDSLT